MSVLLAYLFQIQLLVVTSNSMQPTFGVGDVLLAKGQEHYALQDIVSFKADTFIATHRIVAIKNGVGFETQGDANAVADLRVITKENIIGKIIGIIPKIGYFVLFVQSRYMRMCFVFLLIAYLTHKTTQKLTSVMKKSYEK